MTDKELMALVNRYTEACDDLGAGLFKQTEAETTAKHAKAAELYGQIQAEVKRLHADLANAWRMRMEFGDIISNQCIAMQAAVIDTKFRSGQKQGRPPTGPARPAPGKRAAAPARMAGAVDGRAG